MKNNILKSQFTKSLFLIIFASAFINFTIFKVSALKNVGRGADSFKEEIRQEGTITDEKQISEEAERRANDSIKSFYNAHLWNKFPDASRECLIQNHAYSLHKRLNNIAQKASQDQALSIAEIGIFPQKYDEFCKRYVCPEFFQNPKAGDLSTFNTLDDQYIELFRGVHGQSKEECDRYFNDFTNGNFFLGAEKFGAYCAGDICVPSSAFANLGSYGEVMRFCYKENDMKMICVEDLQAIVKCYFDNYHDIINQKSNIEKNIFNLLINCFSHPKWGPFASAPLAQQALAARILGFDAVVFDESPGNLKIGILNRSKLIVQDQPARIYENGHLIKITN